MTNQNRRKTYEFTFSSKWNRGAVRCLEFGSRTNGSFRMNESIFQSTRKVRAKTAATADGESFRSMWNYWGTCSSYVRTEKTCSFWPDHGWHGTRISPTDNNKNIRRVKQSGARACISFRNLWTKLFFLNLLSAKKTQVCVSDSQTEK